MRFYNVYIHDESREFSFIWRQWGLSSFVLTGSQQEVEIEGFLWQFSLNPRFEEFRSSTTYLLSYKILLRLTNTTVAIHMQLVAIMTHALRDSIVWYTLVVTLEPSPTPIVSFQLCSWRWGLGTRDAPAKRRHIVMIYSCEILLGKSSTENNFLYFSLSSQKVFTWTGTRSRNWSSIAWFQTVKD